MTHTVTVTDRAAADFLTSPKTRFLLGPFMQRETTRSEAAAALGGVGLNTLHRRAKQMLTLGLIEVTREEVRRGHRVKLCRATSRLEGHKAVGFEAATRPSWYGDLGVRLTPEAAQTFQSELRFIKSTLERLTTPWRGELYFFFAGLHPCSVRFPVPPNVPCFGMLVTRRPLFGTKFRVKNSDRFAVASGILVPRCPPPRMPEVCWFMTFYPVGGYFSLYPLVVRDA